MSRETSTHGNGRDGLTKKVRARGHYTDAVLNGRMVSENLSFLATGIRRGEADLQRVEAGPNGRQMTTTDSVSSFFARICRTRLAAPRAKGVHVNLRRVYCGRSEPRMREAQGLLFRENLLVSLLCWIPRRALADRESCITLFKAV